MEATMSISWGQLGGRFLVHLGLLMAMACVTGESQAVVRTLFEDDFQAQPLGGNPATPIVGETWTIREANPAGISVVGVVGDATQRRMRFGNAYNTAVVPFSADNQALIALKRNLTVSFDYFASSAGGYISYFDLGGYNTTTGKPAFLIRMMPPPKQSASNLHHIYYLDPAGGLKPSGLFVAADTLQAIKVSVDFNASTYQLDVGSSSTTLPLFTCPSTINNTQMSAYMIGSGATTYTEVDNLKITLVNPEPATMVLLGVGGLFLGVILWARRRNRR